MEELILSFIPLSISKPFIGSNFNLFINLITTAMEDTLKATLVMLTRGSFSEKGNFSGYTTKGVRIHIPALMMSELGYDKDKKPEFPLYACVVERTFDILNDEDKPTGETFTRAQAGSIFKSKAEAIEAMNSDDLLALEAKAELYKGAKSFGLTEDTLKKLETSPF